MAAICNQVTQVSKYKKVPPSQIVRDSIRATKWRDTARVRTMEKIQLADLLNDKEALGESCNKNEMKNLIPQSAGNQQESKQFEIASASGSSHTHVVAHAQDYCMDQSTDGTRSKQRISTKVSSISVAPKANAYTVTTV